MSSSENYDNSEEVIVIKDPKNFPFEPRPLETPSPLLNDEPIQPPTSILREDHPIPGIIDEGSSSSSANNDFSHNNSWHALEEIVDVVDSLSGSIKNGISKTIDSAKNSYEHAREQCGDVISFMMSGSLSPLTESEKEFSESKKYLREKLECLRAWTDLMNLFDSNNSACLTLEMATELQEMDKKMKEAWVRFDNAREGLEQSYMVSFRSAAKDYSISAALTAQGSVNMDTNDWVGKRVKIDEEKERMDRFYFVDLRFSKEVLEFINERLDTAESLIRRAEVSKSQPNDDSDKKQRDRMEQEEVVQTCTEIRECLRTFSGIVDRRVKDSDRNGSKFASESVEVAVHKVRQEEEEGKQLGEKMSELTRANVTIESGSASGGQ